MAPISLSDSVATGEPFFCLLVPCVDAAEVRSACFTSNEDADRCLLTKRNYKRNQLEINWMTPHISRESEKDYSPIGVDYANIRGRRG